MRPRTLTDLAAALDEQVHRLSELSDEELQVTILTIERAYTHTLIERGLRDFYESGVSQ